MIDHYITFAAPQILQPEIDEVVDTMRSGWLGSGPKVARFEDMFREYIGAKYAIATNSCTAAMHLSLLAAGIGPGDEVITTPMTFVSTVNSIIHAGARPVLVDCELKTGLIDPEMIEDAITPYTEAIMPVHLYGRTCDIKAINDIAIDNGLLTINDAAHAIEAMRYNVSVGDWGGITCFSFYITKNIVTGAGGMITIREGDWADKIRQFANHGMSANAWKRYSDEGYGHYHVDYPGYEYGMNDIQASIGIHQLERVEQNWQRRDVIWHRYNDAFANLPIGLPPPDEPNTKHARHLYTVIVDPETCKMDRDDFMGKLHERGIGTGVHFIGVHLQPYYRKMFGYYPQDYPNATWISERTISLPLSAKLTDDEVDYIIESVKAVLK